MGLTIPAFSMVLDDLHNVKANADGDGLISLDGTSLLVHSQSEIRFLRYQMVGNENLWLMAASDVGVIAFFGVIAVVHIATFFFAVFHVIVFVRAKGCRLSIATMSLGMSLIGLPIAILHWTVDPNGILLCLHYQLSAFGQ